ncbi:hypothetical protein PN462_10580 [Spirulina sp. CS-785/01]|uniref:hypothetical protein n=1 Tax=Spirulina sp. CS-785/01 TaxID=3021716 RepID=UPI00232D86B0|nr:hypothetical protein [Spirulina sp. CS-785/01]MDB9313545.1 hypothetical protein [Spirulina sp. CS-785/01]
MADIQLTQQSANDDNWAYQVTVNGQHNYNVTLSQSDYQQWTSGNTSPDRVIEAAFQ